MNLFPRLREGCPRGYGSVASGTQGASRGPLPRSINRVYLSGILAADPLHDRARDGAPMLLLLIAFPAPDALDTEERPATASCEVEVPKAVVEKYGTTLTAGDSVFVTGKLSGGGGVLATEVCSRPPNDPDGK